MTSQVDTFLKIVVPTTYVPKSIYVVYATALIRRVVMHTVTGNIYYLMPRERVA